MDEVEVKQTKLSSQFQNRLVGVIVLVALGVIFLPDILDGKKQHQEEQFAEIPLRPSIEESFDASAEFEAIDLSNAESQFIADDETVSDKDTVLATEEGVKQEQLSESANKATKAAAEKVVPSSAYTLQLGSFKNAANVNALVKRLRSKGFRAYTVPKTPKDGELTKVFVGPDVSMSKLQKLQKEIDKLTGLKSAVVSFNPVE
ncbi:SPOR domain-containing protein [Shewanella psychrotolerans]|uniref:SPOR domain-containing protein n=1 Tax=Shewanella psychrotolerans TaxID=2864206 RepID=UPI001C660837|nr:SPOR domain-containing protein [Shewanella psychrotolerans]QYK02863.1 SPOR domain-containing protein [Shewanella psychrotolerans]